MWHYIFLILATSVLVQASGGYHYPAPFLIKPAEESGHFFSSLSTVAPLPAVPTLPPLPTPRPSIQSIHQVHPTQGHRDAVLSSISRITQNYLPPQRDGYSHGTVSAESPFTINYQNDDEDFYLSNGRQLKQYAVIEIIDNDLEAEPQKPFLTSDFFDPMRARIGGSGIGATAFSGAPENQYQGRVNALLLEQQRIAQQLKPQAAAGDTINLGSGGIGYIRLPNGNVYLGSGSLGYISGQEHSQSVLEARTRAEGNSPDALHFGHGSLSRNT